MSSSSSSSPQEQVAPSYCFPPATAGATVPLNDQSKPEPAKIASADPLAKGANQTQSTVGVPGQQATPSTLLPPYMVCQDNGADYSEYPVRYANGEILLVETDLSSNGFGQAWGHRRSYSNQLSSQDSGINGNSWFVEQLPSLASRNADPFDPNHGTIAVIGLINNTLWFDWNESESEFEPRFFVKDRLEHDANAMEFIHTDTQGRVTIFYDFSVAPALQGKFKRSLDQFGNNREAVYDVNNRLEKVQQTATDPDLNQQNKDVTVRYYYNYVSSGAGFGNIETVRLTVQRGTQSEVNVRRAQYSYWDGTTDRGNLNDLMQVIISEFCLTGSTWYDISKSCYHYYKPNESNGFTHGLKFVIGPEAYQRMLAASHNPLTSDDETTLAYADYFFQYDSQKRVVSESVRGEVMTFAFSYHPYTDPQLPWTMRTEETLPDGNVNKVYTNEMGQVVLKVFCETGTSNKWFDYFEYDEKGRMTLRAESAAINYSEVNGEPVISLKTSGAIHTFEYFADTETTQGSAPGYFKCEKIQNGLSAPDITVVREYLYLQHANAAGAVIYPIWKETRYRDMYEADPVVTEFAYTWILDTQQQETLQVEDRTTIWPAVPTNEHGDDTSAERVEQFDEFGLIRWVQDERGIISGFKYDLVTGGLIQRTDDASSSSNPPWTPTSGSHFNLVTDFTPDNLGRIIEVLKPVHPCDIAHSLRNLRQADWTIFRCDLRQVWRGRGYYDVDAETYTLEQPVSIIRQDWDRRVIDLIQSTRPAGPDGKLEWDDSFPQSAWTRWIHKEYDQNGLITEQRLYYNIPVPTPPATETAGSLGTNYVRTQFGYDIMLRINKIVSPGATIRRFNFFARGWLKEILVGTNDTTGSSNMKVVESYEYDNGASGGNGNRTKVTRPVDSSSANDRVFNLTHNFRNFRETVTGPENLYELYSYDNFNRLIVTYKRDGGLGGALLWMKENRFDTRGRVFTVMYYTAQSIYDNYWFDAAGNLVRQMRVGSDLYESRVLDNLGRVKRRYLAYDDDGDAMIVLHQDEMLFDDGGNLTLLATRQRFHNTSGSGDLQGPTGSAPSARRSYVAYWPDGIGRLTRRADYGTNGGNTLSRPDLAPTSSTADVHLSKVEFNDRGEAWRVTDPVGTDPDNSDPGKINESTFDDAGRLTEFVEDAASGHLNRTTEFAYNADSQLITLIAHNSVTGNQTTAWEYGFDSDLCSNDLVRKKTYPRDANDRVLFGYNRQGELTDTLDQLGLQHLYYYDKLGRLLHDRVAELPEEMDDTVMRISRTYNARGLLETITSWKVSADSSDPDDIADQVTLDYDIWGQLTEEKQAHDGQAQTSSPRVQYVYDLLRRTQTIYPNGRVLSYGYDGEMNDAISRVNQLLDGTGETAVLLAEYQFLGLSTPVRLEYPEPEVQLTYIQQSGDPNGDAGDIYIGLDRFGRLVDQRWLQGSTALERVKYGYDHANNRMWRQNVAAGTGQDELYAYDGLYQVTDLKRGTLSSGQITSPDWQETFQFDPTGNWHGTGTGDDQAYITKVSGSATLKQNRAHNAANEITGISETVGDQWIDPVHDAAGNLTTIPQPESPTDGFTCVWDAWYRLAVVKEGETTVATYRYDGLNRRIKKIIGNDTRHYFYSDLWQAIEERLNSATTAQRQFIWGLRGLDDLVLRDRDVNNDGTMDERFYGIQDAQNMTAIVDNSGYLLERYGYNAFGGSRVMADDWSTRSASLFDWEIRFGGYRWDAETGLYQVRYRYLHPGLGSWISRDPIAQFPNVYIYASNNTTTYIDSYGLFTVTVLELLIGIAVLSGIVYAFIWCKNKLDKLFDITKGMMNSKEPTASEQQMVDKAFQDISQTTLFPSLKQFTDSGEHDTLLIRVMPDNTRVEECVFHLQENTIYVLQSNFTNQLSVTMSIIGGLEHAHTNFGGLYLGETAAQYHWTNNVIPTFHLQNTVYSTNWSHSGTAPMAPESKSKPTTEFQLQYPPRKNQ